MLLGEIYRLIMVIGKTPTDVFAVGVIAVFGKIYLNYWLMSPTMNG